jgi:hypothetical protein
VKPNTYNISMDPNARGQNLVNPLTWEAGGISARSTVTNLANSVGGSLGTLNPLNYTVGRMREQAQEIQGDFRAMAGSNGYGFIDRAVHAASSASNNALSALSQGTARLKVR